MHGWGAPGTDLVPLARPLEAPGRLFVFPEAPLVSPGGGRAWWHIDMARLISSRDQGRERELRRETPVGLEEARARISALLAEVTARTGLPSSAIALGGFSQGAMLATDVALTSPEPVGALVILSGSIIAESAWTERLRATRPTYPVFMSHGSVDPVLPFGIAEALREQLRAAGREVTWVPFDDGHGIPLEVLTRLNVFLLAAVGPRPGGAPAAGPASAP
jgi:phospholipase/carboxylesterase